MNKLPIFILAFTINLICFGQIKSESELIGKWAVVKMIDKPTEAQFKPIVDAFEKCTFNFKSNHDFELTTTNETELYKMMVNEVLNENVKWRFNSSTKKIGIGNSIMFIQIVSNNEEPVFHIEETGLNLLVKKIE